MIIGLGAGRCGTKSLAHLLDSQKGVHMTHERYRWRVPWHGGEGIRLAFRLTRECIGEGLAGDAAFYWLPYAGQLMKAENTKFICLKRKKSDVVKSFMRITPGRNHWQRYDQDNSPWHYDKWDGCFPQLDARLSKRKAVGQYWDAYYQRARELERMWPGCFKVFQSPLVFQDSEYQRKMLYFAGVRRPSVDTSIHLNQSAPT